MSPRESLTSLLRVFASAVPSTAAAGAACAPAIGPRREPARIAGHVGIDGEPERDAAAQAAAGPGRRRQAARYGRSLPLGRCGRASASGDAVHRLTHLGRLFAESGRYAARHKTWWLMPMIAVLLLLALLIATGQKIVERITHARPVA